MRRILSLTLMVLALQVVIGQPSRGSSADQPPVPAKFGVAKPPETKEGDVNVSYTGVVTEVTKTSIAVRWPGQDDPKVFVASPTLLAGGFPTLARPPGPGRQPRTVHSPYRYRLADVKVGDQVEIYFAQMNGAFVCDQISIVKRPGGRVPPLPEGAEPLKPHPGMPLIQYHERMNAYWDLKDKGIPYPEKFGPYRRWPEAPMPREVGAAPTVSPAVAP